MKYTFMGMLAAVVLATPALAGTAVSSSKMVAPVEAEVESWWTATLSAGWDSKYLFRNVNVLDDEGLFWTDLNASAYGFNIGAWYANGYDSDYTELDLYASYTYDFGPVALTGGYIYYAYPDDDGEETSEIYGALSTSKLPYVTPTLSYYYDVDAIEGSYIEFKLASSIPVVADTLSIDPFAAVSYQIDYNYDGDGWNGVTVGVAVPWVINDVITVKGYVAGSFPLDDLEQSQDDEFYGGASVSFTF